MKVTSKVQGRFDSQYRILDKMYSLFTVGEEQHDVAVIKLVALLEEPEGAVTVAVRTFEELGILTRRISFEGYQQQRAHITLEIPLHEAKARLEAWHERQRMSTTPLHFPSGRKTARAGARQHAAMTGEPIPTVPESEPLVKAPQPTYERVVITTSPKEETKAIAGPEKESPFEILRPLRKSEARALLEAARQYRSKSRLLTEKLEELRQAGFTIPDESMFSFKTDERLETIALVVPLFDELEHENARVSEWVEKLKQANSENEQLQVRLRRLQRERDEQLARSVRQPAVPVGS